MHPYTGELLSRGRRVADWLLTQIDERGNITTADDLYAYTKCPYALTLAGRPDMAALLLGRLLERFETADGDLMYDEAAGKKTWEPYTSYFCQTYANSWVILAAQLLGQTDTVRRLNGCLLNAFYDEDFGAMRCSRRPLLSRYDTTSAAVGILCLQNERRDVAERLGGFLIRAAAQQPEPEKRFYSNVDQNFAFVTELDPRLPHLRIVENGKPGQAVWPVGYPIAALAKLYESTGKKEYLDGAHAYCEAFWRAGEPAVSCAGSGKALWGFAIMYRLTGGARYEQTCRAILDHYFTQQAPDGSFPVPGFVPEDEDMLQYSVIFDTTPEYGRWFYEVAAELNGRP